MSARDRRILVGLASAEHVERVTVRWSWGKTQTWDKLAPNRYWELHEGAAQAWPAIAPPRPKSEAGVEN